MRDLRNLFRKLLPSGGARTGRKVESNASREIMEGICENPPEMTIKVALLRFESNRSSRDLQMRNARDDDDSVTAHD